ncbi:MAG: hypothetical protein JOY70_03020 [Acidisphaera sp.]|nr:hypothetical protein [Acidisphaera sp.]MBV9812924.1 hypothetical protein [Acetobacteraceae bacterium]
MLWIGVAAPLVSWYGERARALADRRMLALRMQVVADELPELQHRAEAAVSNAPTVLDGATDAIASAHLQELVQAMAGQAGAVISSMETLPVENGGGYHRLALRVTLDATWPRLTALLQATQTAAPQLLISDLHVASTRLGSQATAVPLNANITVIAFRLDNGAASP